MKKNAVVLNTDAHRPARDAFITAMNDACRGEGWRAHECVSYFLETSFRAMRGAIIRNTPEWQKNEDAYMRIVSRMRDKNNMNGLSGMLAATVAALEAEPVDFLGPIFSEVAASSSLGQFFTPWHLSRVLAEQTMGDCAEMVKRKGVVFVHEPACGVGGMVLAANDVLRSYGVRPHRDVHWHIVDVDFSAMCGAYIQTNLCGISADVLHGNSLSLEVWTSTPTLAAVTFPKRRREEAAPAPPPPPAPPAKPLRPAKAELLSLF